MPFKSSRTNRPKPMVSTASLPDIVFMLLFFFMVVTVLRDASLRLQIHLPHLSELEQLHRKELVNHIYIGQPINEQEGTSVVVQINDAFISSEKLESEIKQMIALAPKHLRPKLIASLYVDGDVKMGTVTEVKTALRKAQQLKVNYAALPKGM